MKQPTVQRVPVVDVEAAIARLRHAWELPDGNELTDHHAVRRYEAQIRQGFYERLVWPPGTTLVEVEEWLAMATLAVQLHRRRLV